MVLIERANPTDRLDVERLIAAYLTSEGVKPRPHSGNRRASGRAGEPCTVGTSSSARGRPFGGRGTLPVRIPSRIRGNGPAGGFVRDLGPSALRGAGPSRTRSRRTPPWIRGTPSRRA